MRIVFAGTPKNAADTLQALLERGFEIVGVLTRLNAPIGRKKIVSPSPVAKLAESKGLPVWKSNSLDEQALNWLSSLEPDIGVIVAYGAILNSKALEAPKAGWVNVHYSLLPDYPGAAPVQLAILEGRHTSGVTVFALDEGIDTGPIYSQREVAIPLDATAGIALELLSKQGIELLDQTLRDIGSGVAVPKKQQLPSPRKLAAKLTRSDSRVNFNSPAQQVANLIRAMNPEPMAWFELDGLPVRALEARVSEATPLSPGLAMLDSGGVIVGCSDSCIELVTVQPAGKTAMPAADWFRGLRKDQVKLT